LLDTLDAATSISPSNESPSLEISFNTSLASVDLESRTAYFANDASEKYDLIIGSDGVNSPLRKQMTLPTAEGGHQPIVAEEILLPGQFKVMQQSPHPVALESDAVHAMESTDSTTNSSDRFNMFLIPAPGNSTCAILSWKGTDTPPALAEGSDPAVANSAIEKLFPQFGTSSPAALQQLLSQRPSEVRTVRCNRYHSSAGGALLLGDAAHSTGGALGQGANSALQDVVQLARCLEKCTLERSGEAEVDMPAVLKEFSSTQVAEGLALFQLLQLPPKGPSGLFYQFVQLLLGALINIPGVGRFFPKPTQIMLSQSLTSFSEIVHKNQFWINMATKNIRVIHYEPEQ